MPTLNVDLGARSYPILIEKGLFKQPLHLKSHISTGKVVIVSNDTVAPLYLEQVTSQLSNLAITIESIILPDGEQYKTLESFANIQTRLMEFNCSRDTTLIALGGGVIGDLAGFSAACYQRGIPFIQIPTTLLSQVDSSVGGKTAVNHPLGKNMIGAFYQPVAVLVDTNSLSSLPDREFSAGMAEVIKYGIMFDSCLFDWIEKNAQSIADRNPESLKHIIFECCRIKAEIVRLDEREKGVRALLNLGHTFGHAIEAEKGYGAWLHGEAVAAGMVIASILSETRGLISETVVKRITQLIKFFQLPTNGPEEMLAKHYTRHMKRDKKVLGNKMRFILPTELGSANIFDDVTDEELVNLLG